MTALSPSFICMHFPECKSLSVVDVRWNGNVSRYRCPQCTIWFLRYIDPLLYIQAEYTHTHTHTHMII